jgi:hypothetical protein
MEALSPLQSRAAAAALLTVFVLGFALALVLRSWRVVRRTGINPVVLPNSDDAAGYVGRGFRLVLVCTALWVVLVAASPATAGRLGLFAPVPLGPLALLGWPIVAAALALMWAAQEQMGASGRVGIDRKRATALVGLVLLVPAAPTLALLVAAEILIQVQVRLEEAHLSALHGGAYDDYRAQVRRWWGRHVTPASTQP